MNKQKVLCVVLVVAGMFFIIDGATQQIVYAQSVSTTATGTTITDFTALMIAVGSVLGSVGVILGAVVPWVRKLNAKVGTDIGKVADVLVEAHHKIQDTATKVQTNQVRIETAIDAMKQLANLTPEQKVQMDALLVKSDSKIQEITAQAEQAKQALDRLHATLPTTVNQQ